MIKIRITIAACRVLSEKRTVTLKPPRSGLPQIELVLADDITFIPPEIWMETPKKEDMN